jgi:hypothetical protein
MSDQSVASLRIGTKVRIKDYPPPTDPHNGFNYNGHVGVVIASQKIGLGINNNPVYLYDVLFENVTVNYTERDFTTGKLIRGTRTQSARNFFEEPFIDVV